MVHAAHAIVPAQGDGVAPPAAPDTRVFVVRANLEVHPTFRDTSAMRGTGSNAASADDLFVPDGFVFRWTDPLRVERPAYRLPYFLQVRLRGRRSGSSGARWPVRSSS